MNLRDRAPLNKRRFGRTLRQLRDAAGMTQEEVGQRLRFSDSKISRFEAGQLPPFYLLGTMLDLYGVPTDQWAGYQNQWDRANVKGWWTIYKIDNAGYVSMEHEAVLVRTVEPGVIPALLQTRAYAGALFAKSARQRSKRWIGEQVNARLHRQRRLVADQPLVFEAIIQEGVLYRRDTGVDEHRNQLRRLVSRAALPNVTLRVMPESAGTHDGLSSALTVLRFPDKEDRDAVHIEHALGATDTDDPSRSSAAIAMLDRLATVALAPAESAELIQAVVDRM